jgi:hypothetical protein
VAGHGRRGGAAARSRRALVVAVLLCAAGAGLGLVALHRGWRVEVLARPAPLPDERLVRTGSDLLAWAAAAGWLALAGAGALVATRGSLRQLVGALLCAAGLGLAAGAGWAALQPEIAPLWPATALAGGLAVAAAGGWALLRGRRWPAMAARYERPRPSGPAAGAEPERWWDALDRGEDPTGDGPDRTGDGPDRTGDRADPDHG